jgi:hypothetical protein
MQRDATIAPGEQAWWGAAVLFVNDDPREPQAADFRDERSVDDILALWAAFAADRTPQAIHDDALAEMDAWRAATAPAALTDQERILWRQSESILRMAQVREPRQPNRDNDGMVLAALPPGEWHTGWVRDAQYAIVAYAMTGHANEARLGLEFFLGADGATNGFFQQEQYLGAPYRVSVTRYFGNGKEEGDFNSDGPNIETDGWGLVLWAARMYLHYSCDVAWLDVPTWRGDTVYEALETVAADIEEQMRGGLPGPDASIWEVHWNRRQVFAYTAASQIRGLLDFADIADAHGRTDRATHYRELARSMLEASTGALVYRPQQSFASHLGVSSSPVHVDGSTVEFFNWGLVDTGSPVYMGTLNNYSRLVTGFGGYQRLEPMLSLTGEGSASAYDVSEWVLLDLRIGQAWRRMGRAELADALLDKVTAHASVNDFLIPELFDRSNGRYTGVVPMVGYGAGAWMMEQLDRHGQPAPRHDATFLHCSEMPPDGGVPGTDGGVRAGTDGGTRPGEDGGGGPGFDDRRAVLCSTGGRGNVPVAVLVLAAIAALAIRRRP